MTDTSVNDRERLASRRRAAPPADLRPQSGQLAGAGATRVLAAFGAQVIRIEDPVTKGLWDIVRQLGPYIDGDRGPEGGSGFNNHNVEKLGITLNLRTERGKELLRRAGARSRRGHRELRRRRDGAARLRLRRPQGAPARTSSTCPTAASATAARTARSRSWGPIVQAVCGLTFTSGLPDQQPAGWGYSYMDHTGGYVMAIALLAALYHQRRTGEGQWVDMACIEAAATLNGPALLDGTVNGRPLRRDGSPNSNRSNFPAMAPHGIYPCRERRLAGWPSPAATTPTGARLARACLDDAAWPTGWARPGRARRRRRRAGPSTRDPRRGRRARCRAAGVPVAPVRARRSAATTTSTPPHGACGRRSSTPSTARSASTACRCTCRAPTGSSGAAGRCSARTTTGCFGEVLGLDAGRDRRAARRGGDLMGPLDGRPGGRAGAPACAPGPASCSPTSAPTSSWSSRRAAAPQRTYEPFLDDVPGPERSLWWWHYNTSKRGVVIDPRTTRSDASSWPRLAHGADVVLAGRAARPRRAASATDDRSRSRVVGQRARRARHRPDAAGRGRPGVELRLRRPHAAAGARRRQPGLHTRVALGGDVGARGPAGARALGPRSARRRRRAAPRPTSPPRWRPTAGWRATSRCSARPAATPRDVPSMPTQVLCADGRFVNAGIMRRASRPSSRAILAWLAELGLRDEFELTAFLEMGAGGHRDQLAPRCATTRWCCRW